MTGDARGAIAGRFELGDLLGTGGMGAVYDARDLVTGERVALKLLRAAAGVAAARFDREASVLAELRHAGIVRYVAHGSTDDEVPWLAMERLEGEDLGARLRRSRVAVEDALALVRRVADALASAHAKGVVHRDVKPSNLFLVGGDPRAAVVLDFGIARVVDAPRGLTATGAILGTPGYMAPEQVRAGSSIAPAVDVFALGCVLYECLAGAPAFTGDHIAAVLAKVLLDEPAPIAERAPRVPDGVVEIVRAMLAKDPARRLSDGGAVRDAIDALGGLATSDTVAVSATVGTRTTTSGGLTREERRFVSVVLASAPVSPESSTDPTGATRIDLVRASTTELASIADRFGARADRFIDGTIVVTALAPVDGPFASPRAARCALAMRAALPSASVTLATAIVEPGAPRPLAAVLDRAAALAAADVGDDARAPVWIDEATAALLPPRFHVEPLGERLVLVEERDTTRATRTVRGRPTPFVGREQELVTLRAALDRASRDREPVVALVVGEAGAGKSRLREELLDAAPASRVLFGAGDPLRQSSPHGVIAHALRRLWGIAEHDSIDAQRAKVIEGARACVAGEDAERVALFLAELIGAAPVDASPKLAAARRDPQLMSEQIQRAFLDLVGAEAARGPVTLVLEDLHWADAPSVKLVEAALRALRDRPLFVLGLARPQVDDAFPRLFAGRGATRVELGELGRRACERMIRAIGDASLGDADVERLASASAGNPLFAEELVRAGAAASSELPSGLLAIVQSRLAAYDEETRRVLRAASVFGQAFSSEGVVALLGDVGARDARVAIELLVDQEVLVPAEADLAFRHALVREAAYAMLTDADRALGHRLAAEFLATSERASPAILAHHLERAGATKDAARLWIAAAADALTANDLDAALALAARGLEGGVEGRDRGEALRVIAEAHYWRADYAASRAAGVDALEILAPGSASRFGAIATYLASSDKVGAREDVARVATELAGASPRGDAAVAFVEAAARCAPHLLTSGGREAADELFAAIDRAGPIDDGPVFARVLHARAIRAGIGGDTVAFLELESAASRGFEDAGDARSACATRSNAGYASFELGDYPRAETLLREAAATARDRGLSNTFAFAIHNLGLVLAARGELVEAKRLELESLAYARAQGDARLEAGSLGALAKIALLGGDAARTDELCREALAALPDGSPLRLTILAELTRSLLARGRADDALEEASEAMCLLAEIGHADGETSARLAYAEALVAADRAGEARATIARLAAEVAARAAAITDERLRRSFLAVVENARCLELEAAWCGGVDSKRSEGGSNAL